jgi:preprotein translocase SecE subunit
VADSVQDDGSDSDDAALERAALAGAPSGGGAAVAGVGAGQVSKSRGLGRFTSFLRASWAELQRVQWPDRGQVGQATAVVIGFVIVAGAYLGAADAVAKKVVDIIL